MGWWIAVALSALSVLGIVGLQCMHLCGPNEVLVLSGRARVLPDGSRVGYRVVTEGRALRVPVLERLSRMPLRPRTLDLRIRNAYSTPGVPLNIAATARVAASADPALLPRAIERFLDGAAEIDRVAAELIEGHVRGIAARFTPESLFDAREVFAELVRHEAEESLGRVGLRLLHVEVSEVSDDLNYLVSVVRHREHADPGRR